MKLEFDDNRALYLQIAESIENEILRGVLEEEEQVTSTTQFATQYRINPATAAKGINILVDEGTLYKKRGIGMFVSTGAVKAIKEKRKEAFKNDYINPLLKESMSLDISKEELISMIKETKEFNKNGKD